MPPGPIIFIWMSWTGITCRILHSARPLSKRCVRTLIRYLTAAPYIEAFAEAGADIITIHAEADDHTHRVLQQIKATGKKAGIALNPATPTDVLDHIMDLVDLVLVMTVNPGFGGQSYIALDNKIADVCARIDATGRDIDLQVDGGITDETARMVKQAGANVLVAGTYVFKDGTKYYSDKISSLRKQ